jgi:hypothetical protein
LLQVLPPWGRLYHWTKAEELTGQKKAAIPWSAFFDIGSMDKYVPVIDLKTFTGC